MTQKELDKYKKTIADAVASRKLHVAFTALRNVAATIGSWELNEDIDRIEQSYKMMLKYAVDAIDDPQRENVYQNIVAAILRLFDQVSRLALKATQSPRSYFATLRLLESQHVETITNLFESYNALLACSDMFSLISGKSQTSDQRQHKVKLEQLEIKVFNKVWVDYPLSVQDEAMLSQALNSSVLPTHFRQLIVSAILLGLLEYYDEARLRLLFSAYQSATEHVAVKSLCAAVMGLYVHRNRTLSPKLLALIDALKELPQWQRDLKMVFLQLIRTRDVERINRKMQDELLPQMMKMRPDLYKNLRDSQADIDLHSLDENPEWQDFLENSGLADKMKELSELQQEGSDVFMSTFSHLKSYPFFSFFSNWFLPFHVEQSDVVDALGNADSVLASLIASSPFLCDSDKYSFALSMKSIPAVHRDMMLSQLNAQNLNMAELHNSELLPADKTRENIANKYIQDLYRFFKLNRNRGDFTNPFVDVINLVDVKVIAQDFNDAGFWALVAEFYFSRKFYAEAFDAFQRLTSIQPPSARLFQKMGFAKQQLGDIEQALKYYEQAELFDGENAWTLRRIAFCYKSLAQYDKAIDYLNRAENLLPDNTAVAINLGDCLMAVGSYSAALNNYFKVEYIDGESPKIWRKLAWCLLLANDFQQSEQYFHKIIGGDTLPEDYMNFGHLYFAKADFRLALEMYRRSYEMLNDVDKFMEMFNNDMPYLKILQVNHDIMPFLIDAVFYDNI